jgi:hypothetical protein
MQSPPTLLIDDEAWKGLDREKLGMFISEAVGSLPNSERERFMGLSVMDGWEGVSEFGVVGSNAFRVGVVVDSGEGDGSGRENHKRGMKGKGGGGNEGVEVNAHGVFTEGM